MTGRLTSRDSQQPGPSVLLAAESPSYGGSATLIDGDAGGLRCHVGRRYRSVSRAMAACVEG